MKKLILASVFLTSLLANAEIEKIAEITNRKGEGCNGKICFYWWPKVQLPEGWEHDRSSSLLLNSNVIVPVGSTFANAETIMYARAMFKPRMKDTKSLEALMESDRKDFLAKHKGMKAKDLEPLQSGDSKPFKVVSFSPSKKGNWEQVAYGEETEYYLVFTISSQGKNGLERDLSKFKELIERYKEKPTAP